jgi:hypothetical protein
MFALGQKRTLQGISGMSALPPIADIRQCNRNVEFEDGVIERIYEYYRSIFQTRPSLPHIQVAIDDIAKVRPNVSGMTPADLIETRFLDEIETELH